MHRVMVFLDWQNLYKGARETFGLTGEHHAKGQVHPVALGRLLAGRRPEGRPRELVGVRVYVGRPDPRMDARTYAAHMRQCAAWEKTGVVTVRSRQLRYPRGWPDTPAQEKGVDVQLAVDLVMGYLAGEFDVGIVFSTDTDLVPALEAAYAIAGREGRRPPEVAAWRGRSGRGRRSLRISGRPLWCHWLDWADYQKVADTSDYNIAGA